MGLMAVLAVLIPTSSLPAEYPHLLLGDPSQTAEDKSKGENFLLKKEFFAVSYNDAKRSSNRVSWRVRKADVTAAGDGGRKRTVSADADLASAFYRVAHKDFPCGGFGRCHLCQHGDRVATSLLRVLHAHSLCFCIKSEAECPEPNFR